MSQIEDERRPEHDSEGGQAVVAGGGPGGQVEHQVEDGGARGTCKSQREP